MAAKFEENAKETAALDAAETDCGPMALKRSAPLTKANREVLVRQLVVFLSDRPDELAQFFALSGIDQAALRDHVDTPAFQDGLLSYLASNEPLLLAFCDEMGLAPEAIVALIGGTHLW